MLGNVRPVTDMSARLSIRIPREQLNEVRTMLVEIAKRSTRGTPQQIMRRLAKGLKTRLKRRAPERTKAHRIPKSGKKRMTWIDKESGNQVWAWQVNHPGGPYVWHMTEEYQKHGKQVIITVHLPFAFYGKQALWWNKRGKNWIDKALLSFIHSIGPIVEDEIEKMVKKSSQ